MVGNLNSETVELCCTTKLLVAYMTISEKRLIKTVILQHHEMMCMDRRMDMTMTRE